VVDERDGLNSYYRVTDPQVFTLIDTARAMYGIEVDTRYGSPAAACPCPRCTPVIEIALLD
jgi:hypothetical protein